MSKRTDKLKEGCLLIGVWIFFIGMILFGIAAMIIDATGFRWTL